MDGHEAPKTSLKSRGPYVALALIALVAVIAAGVTWFVYLRQQVRPPEPVVVAPVVDAGTPEPAPVDLAEGDALVKGLAPDAWLQGGDAVRRVVAAVNAVAAGESPRVVLGVLEPTGTFDVDEVTPKGKAKAKPRVRGKKGHVKVQHVPSKFFISEENDARYDKVTALVTAIDAAAVGHTYGKLRPYLDAAYREIAPPGKTFDAAFTAAVDRLAAVPISDGPREVIPMDEGVGYRWADPKLEALKPAEKHLLRMGPKNARAVVKQLEAFRAAMNEPSGAGR